MPLWRVWYPEHIWSEADKQALSQAITKAYVNFGLPAFYVGVIYTELGTKDTLYVGGEKRTNFVRISIDQIARDSTQNPLHLQKKMLNIYEALLAPYIRDRGLDWELHIDSTPRTLWRVQGIDPPETGSEGEKLWIEKNAPVPLDHLNNDGAGRPAL